MKIEFIEQALQKGRWREFLLIVCIALAFAGILLLRTNLLTYEHPEFRYSGDHHKYIYMATGNPFGFHIGPFCWRVVNPAIAKALPFDLQWNFLIISFISVWMTGIAIYYSIKILAFSNKLALLGMCMFFSLGWATKFVLRDFWLVDSLNALIITLAIYCVLAKKDLLFLILLMIGVGVKESAIFVAPLYYTFNARKVIDWRKALRTIVLVLPAVAVLISLRMAIHPFYDSTYLSTLPEKLRVIQKGLGSSYSYWDWLKANSIHRLHNLSFWALYDYTIGTFGVMLTILPLFAIKRNINLFLKFAPFLLLVYSQLLVAGNTERLLILGFPVMILLSLNGITAISEGLDVNLNYFFLLPLLYFGFNLIRTETFTNPYTFQSITFLLFVALLFQRRIATKNS